MTIQLTNKQLTEIRKASNLCKSIALMIPTAKRKATMTGECALIAIDVDAVDGLVATANVLREIVDMATRVEE